MSCNRCNCNPCGCSALPGMPEPFYAGAPTCPQDHTKLQYIPLIYFGLTIEPSWNIPLCGASVALPLKANAVPIGSVIWHEAYGYFKVSSFDYDAQQITITNECHPDNEAPGTQIPRCTTFTIGSPPCCTDNTSGVFVKYDFTAPEVDDCIDITLTSVDGLISGNQVQIGSGVYSLAEVKANDVIRICNQGEGITPGTPIIAQNVSGQYVYPVTSISVNGCSQDEVTEGVPLVCVDGSSFPLGGGGTGDLMQQDSSGRGFWSGDIPGAVAAIEADITTIQGDITTIEGDITDIQGDVTNLKGFYDDASSSPVTGNVTTGGAAVESNESSITITNTSDRTIAILYTMTARIYGNVNNADVLDGIDGSGRGASPERLEISFDLQQNIDGGGYTSAVNQNETFIMDSANPRPADRQRVFSAIVTKAPGASFNLSSKVVALAAGGTAGSFYDIDNMDVFVTAIAVPL